ncbi:leucine-rich repeat domain-containing protein [Streptomyces avermitilis]|uniref:leucine-rich repeat domain-containing protein n=1 Tax=Streptomyces avermitilis TaxID=33903 RepID=UPI0033A96801
MRKSLAGPLPLKRLTALTTMALRLSHLTDIGGLGAFPELERLSLQGCDRVEDWTPLLEVPRLRELQLTEHRRDERALTPVLQRLLADGVTQAAWNARW